MKKLLLLFASMFAVFLTANAQLLLQEDFNYPAGDSLRGHGWTITGTSTFNTVKVSNGGLNYAGYIGSFAGNGAYVDSTGQDVCIGFASQTTGTVYASFMVNVAAVRNGSPYVGDYFAHLTEVVGSTGAFSPRIFVRAADNGKIAFGISKSSISTSIPPTFTDSIYSLNTTYLLVAKYQFNAGTTTDDEVSLFVFTNYEVPAFEPGAPSAGPVTSTQTDIAAIAALGLRQGTAANAPTLVVDGIRVGNTWSNVLVNIYDDPVNLTVKNTETPVVLDGKLDEADWAAAPSLLFGNGAFANKLGGDKTVTGGADIKSFFDVNGVKYRLPNTDSSWARVKFLRKGMDLYLGLESNDKSICRFDWEGEGVIVFIKDNTGATKEYKLYYQNIGLNKDTIRYEESVLNSGAGAGFLPVGSTANDTLDVDNGYSAELRIRLDKLGYTAGVSSVQFAMDVFDPDGFQFDASLPWPYGMMPFDSARGSYHKSWWGGEWGNPTRTLELIPEIVKYDDPAKLVVKNAGAAVVLDGKLTEADWAGAPSLLFGNGAFTKKLAGDQTVTGGADIKASFDSYGVTYHLPNTDSSWARVKFLRKGMDLYLGLESNDKSICRFDWEGEGVIVFVKDNTGATKEYKLYYQNIGLNKDTIRYEESILNSGGGAGFLYSGSTANDTMDVDSGYSAELRIRLDKLGYTAGVSSVQFAMDVFDPDGFQFDASLPWPYGMMPFDSARGSYYKSWWGGEWGSPTRTLELTPEFAQGDDPAKLVVKNAGAAVVLDGKLTEADWNGAPSLLFGNGAQSRKQAGDLTVTSGFDLKGFFDVNGVKYRLPNTDSSWARVKFLRKGMDLYLGLESNDKSICRFDWEGEGVIVFVKDNTGATKEYKLYYQNIGLNKDTIRYEESVLNSGGGAGFLYSGSTANDTMNVDSGYSAELRIRLDKLGYVAGVKSVPFAMDVFDPDGFQFDASLPWPYGMSPWDSARGSYYKSWWGGEWGSPTRTLEFTPEYDNPDTVFAKISSSTLTLDGKLTEFSWVSANTLIFGPPNAPKTGTQQTVTGGFDIKASFDVNGVMYHLPTTDISFTKVKFLASGNDLFIGIQSPDKSICKFDWEGDGIILFIKDNTGATKEYKLYYQNIGANKDTIRYEESVLNSGGGAGVLMTGSTVNDTTNIDNGYSAELRVRLDKLGFTPAANKVNLSVAMSIFDPDGYQHPMNSWDSARGTYYKSWWGGEWGGTFKTISVPNTTGVEDLGELPLTFALHQNYPNPFNPSTTIRYAIPMTSPVVITIYNMLGQEITTLVNKEQKPGNYEVKFDAGRFASGIYIYRINAGSFNETKKMMLIK
ncbi:MAG: T9SS type A sorting domain-containing protein [Bacteroidota bacterium]